MAGKRKTRYFFITLTFDEKYDHIAQLDEFAFAEAIKPIMQNFCMKVHNRAKDNDYSYWMMLAPSKTEPYKKRRDRKLKYVRGHIHMLLLANPGKTIKDLIKEEFWEYGNVDSPSIYTIDDLWRIYYYIRRQCILGNGYWEREHNPEFLWEHVKHILFDQKKHYDELVEYYAREYPQEDEFDYHDLLREILEAENAINPEMSEVDSEQTEPGIE